MVALADMFGIDLPVADLKFLDKEVFLIFKKITFGNVCYASCLIKFLISHEQKVDTLCQPMASKVKYCSQVVLIVLLVLSPEPYTIFSLS